MRGGVRAVVVVLALCTTATASAANSGSVSWTCSSLDVAGFVAFDLAQECVPSQPHISPLDCEWFTAHSVDVQLSTPTAFVSYVRGEVEAGAGSVRYNATESATRVTVEFRGFGGMCGSSCAAFPAMLEPSSCDPATVDASAFLNQPVSAGNHKALAVDNDCNVAGAVVGGSDTLCEAAFKALAMAGDGHSLLFVNDFVWEGAGFAGCFGEHELWEPSPCTPQSPSNQTYALDFQPASENKTFVLHTDCTVAALQVGASEPTCSLALASLLQQRYNGTPDSFLWDVNNAANSLTTGIYSVNPCDAGPCSAVSSCTWCCTDHAVCGPCPRGYAGDGATCTECEQGKYSNVVGAAACSDCPAFSTSPVGSTAVGQCACEAGYVDVSALDSDHVVCSPSPAPTPSPSSLLCPHCEPARCTEAECTAFASVAVANCSKCQRLPVECLECPAFANGACVPWEPTLFVNARVLMNLPSDVPIESYGVACDVVTVDYSDQQQPQIAGVTLSGLYRVSQCVPLQRVCDFRWRDCADGGDEEGVEMTCGLDGVVDPGERCDDSNLERGDGCSGLCNIEPGFYCVTEIQGEGRSTSGCHEVEQGTAVVQGEVEMQGVAPEDFDNSTVQSAFRDAVANAVGNNVTREQVEIDQATASTAAAPSNSTGTGTRVEYHITTNSTDAESVAARTSATNSTGGATGNGTSTSNSNSNSTLAADVATGLSALLDREVVVLRVETMGTVGAADPTPPEMRFTAVSSNPLSRFVAGPGHTITLQGVNASKPVVAVEPTTFRVGGARIVPKVDYALHMVECGVSATTPSGALEYALQWEDEAGNLAECTSDEAACGLGWDELAGAWRGIEVDTEQPTLVVGFAGPHRDGGQAGVEAVPSDGACCWETDGHRVCEVGVVLQGNDVVAVNTSAIRAMCTDDNGPECEAIVDPGVDIAWRQSGTEPTLFVRLTVSSSAARKARGGETVRVFFDGGLGTDHAGNTNEPREVEILLRPIGYLATGLFVGLVVVAGLVGLVGLWCLVTFVRNRHHQVVKYSTPLFNNLILLAIEVLLSCVVVAGLQRLPVSYHTRQVACQLFPQLMANACVFTLSLVFARNFRIHRIFNNPNLQSRAISNADLLRFVAATMAVSLGIMLTYALAYPPKAALGCSVASSIAASCDGPSHQQQQGAEQEWGCDFMPSKGAVALLCTELALVLGLLTAGVVLSVRIRRVPSAWNEARHVSYFLYTSVLVVVVAMPAAFFSHSSNSWFVLVSVSVFALTVSPILFLFVAKMGKLAPVLQSISRAVGPFGSTTGRGDTVELPGVHTDKAQPSFQFADSENRELGQEGKQEATHMLPTVRSDADRESMAEMGESPAQPVGAAEQQPGKHP